MSGIFDIGRPLHLHLDGTHVPQLRTLSLSKLSLECDGLVLPNLTTLSLSAIPRSRQPTLNAVLDLLEAAHCMRALTLIHAGPALPPSDSPISRHPVVLDRLHHFVFNGRSAQCSALLSQLLLPHGVHIQLLGDHLHIPENAPAVPVDTRTLMTVLPDNMKRSEALSAIRSVWLQVSGEWFTLTADAKHLDKRNKKPTLLITLGSQEDQYDIFAPNALSELPLIFHDTLTSLHVESGGLSSLHCAQWTALFASFPRLLHLRLLSRTPLSENFFMALGRSGHSLSCPKLKLLSLRCERGTKEGVEEMLEGLYECVLDRSRAGATLATLKVVIPFLSSRWEEHTSRFEGLVDALMFDDPENTQPD
ncbi:hypothetical protein DAEQUDRAFT_761629 [Daedalea quercina L-15889]|uniref:F-box domain-containing protein n=1 Tax=Daedalea quercina L-15889 TaxID=1314783 RepID=A0A165U034_9APHY|nr:hypothetical protein DAEQUDRAFT_761629 [Daedalea quercina L-15889]